MTVKTATAEPRAAAGNAVFARSVTAEGAVNMPHPKNSADMSIETREVANSGIAAPIAMTTPAAASVRAGCQRARGTRHNTGAAIVARPSVPQVRATSRALEPCDTIQATTNVMYAM